MNTMRLDALRLSIREGEMRLALKKQTGKPAIRRAIANARIRIQRIEAGLPEGGMIYGNGNWQYEFETVRPATDGAE